MIQKSTSETLRPTGAELAILRVLWRIGPSTVRDVHKELSGKGDGYTTVLKLLQIMHQKGLVSRDESERAHVYAPAVEKDVAQEQMLGDFVQRVFEGSREQLVLQALGSGRATPEELAKIRALLDEIERRKQ